MTEEQERRQRVTLFAAKFKNRAIAYLDASANLQELDVTAPDFERQYVQAVLAVCEIQTLDAERAVRAMTE